MASAASRLTFACEIDRERFATLFDDASVIADTIVRLTEAAAPGSSAEVSKL